MPANQLGRLATVPLYNSNPNGRVKNRADLPHNPELGEVWFVEEDSVEKRYVWTGKWWSEPTLTGAHYDLPDSFLLTNLTLGCRRNEWSVADRWLKVGSRPLLGEPLKLGEQKRIGFAEAPAHDGGSIILKADDGWVISALEIVNVGAGISVWQRPVLGPSSFKLGQERPIDSAHVRPGVDTKEPRSDGNGYEATQPGCIITGLQILKDPDRTWSLLLAYRPLL